MTDDEAFGDLIRRVRAGDQHAAADLLRQYEPEIRRVIRLRLGGTRLSRVLDSGDVYQSVLANVFVRIAAGQYDAENPEHLLALFLKMARNKMADHARKLANRSVSMSDSALNNRPDGSETPSAALVVGELVSQVRCRLSDHELRVADLRAAGRGWDDIGRELNGSPEALRKQLARAADRVARQLGLDEMGLGI